MHTVYETENTAYQISFPCAVFLDWLYYHLSVDSYTNGIFSGAACQAPLQAIIYDLTITIGYFSVFLQVWTLELCTVNCDRAKEQMQM